MHSLLSVRIQTKNQYLFLLSLLFCVSFFFDFFFPEQNLPLKNYHDVLMESFPCQRRDGNRSASRDRHWKVDAVPSLAQHLILNFPKLHDARSIQSSQVPTGDGKAEKVSHLKPREPCHVGPVGGPTPGAGKDISSPPDPHSPPPRVFAKHQHPE